MTHAEALNAAHIAYADHGHCIVVDREWLLYPSGSWERDIWKVDAVYNHGEGVQRLIEAVHCKSLASGVGPSDWMGGTP